MENEQSLRTDDCAEQVIHLYADLVYRLALTRTSTKFEADEIFQEVFLRYLKKRPVFQSEEHGKAWFIRVTVNCANRMWSSAWRRKIQPLDDNLVFEQKEDQDLHGQLKRLPPKYRQVIHLFYYEELPVEQIGLALGRKSSTVRTQLTRARALLREICKEDL